MQDNVKQTDDQFYRIGKSLDVLKDKSDFCVEYEAHTSRIVIRLKNVLIKIDEGVVPLSDDMVKELFDLQKDTTDLRQLVYVAITANDPAKFVVVDRIDL